MWFGNFSGVKKGWNETKLDITVHGCQNRDKLDIPGVNTNPASQRQHRDIRETFSPRTSAADPNSFTCNLKKKFYSSNDILLSSCTMFYLSKEKTSPGVHLGPLQRKTQAMPSFNKAPGLKSMFHWAWGWIYEKCMASQRIYLWRMNPSLVLIVNIHFEL